jgi:hypothetical protein
MADERRDVQNSGRGGRTMMRLLRQSSIVLLLLASVGTASAECAWVLWAKVSSPKDADTLTVMSASDTLPGCERALRRSLEIRGKLGGMVGGTAVSDLAKDRKTGEEWVVTTHFSCLPDTIDPRGPKR